MNDPSGTVGVLMSAGEDRRLLEDRLTDAGYEVAVAGVADDLPTGSDCVLVGSRLLEGAADALRDRRDAAPTYLPVLLVVTDRRARGGDPIGGLPSSLADLVDDAVTAPIRGDALVRRVAGCCRASRLSARLEESRNRYRRLVEVLPEAVLLLSGGTIRYCNRAAVDLLDGTTAAGDGGVDATAPSNALASALGGESDGSALVGRSFEAVVDPADRATATELLGRRDGSFVGATLSALDGRTVLAEVAATRVGFGGADLTQVVVRDVTERREREEQLRLFRRAMDEASIGVTITDPTRPDNPIVYANEEFAHLTGRDVEWMRGRNPRFAQTDDTDPATAAELRRAIDAEEPASVEILNGRAGGTEWYNALDVTPIRDGAGDVTHFLGFQRDVTERRRRAATFESLHAATDRLQNATDVDAVLEVAVDVAGTVLELPVTACWRHDGDVLRPVAGSDEAWAIGLPSFDADDPEYAPFAAGESASIDVAADTDGAIRRGLFVPLGDYGLLGAADRDRTSYPDYVRDAAAVLADHVTAALDRADREGTLRERERDLERYETILGAAGDPIYTLDGEGRFTDVNDAMVEFAGYERDRLDGSHISLLLDAADIERCEDRIAALVGGGSVEDATAEVTVGTAAGEARECEINIALLPESDDGGFGGSVGVIRDITDRKRRRQRVAVLDRVLRHNLRNKVNVIHGRAERLGATDELPADAERDVETIAAASDGLLDVAEKARAYHRSLSSPRRERDLLTVVEGVVAEFDEAAARNVDVDVAVRVDAARSGEGRDGRRPTVLADDGLELAVSELVENAVEHARDGSTVAVCVRTVEADGRDWVEVEVRDDGDGIPPAERAALDGTVETALSHGSGIGLWLVAWTANRVGGRVTYDDGGSTVGLRLRPARD